MQAKLLFAERRLVKFSIDSSSIMRQDKSPTYTSRFRAGRGTDNMEAIAASSGFQFFFFWFWTLPLHSASLDKAVRCIMQLLATVRTQNTIWILFVFVN